MRHLGHDQKKLLLEIKKKFGRHRRRCRGKRRSYPQPLRELAIGAAGAQIPFSMIGKSAGVSTQAVRVWARMRPGVPRPRALRLVPDAGAAGESKAWAEEPIGAERVRVHFVSGAYLELSLSQLTSEILSNLNRGLI